MSYIYKQIIYGKTVSSNSFDAFRHVINKPTLNSAPNSGLDSGTCS
jgi:hypothetical protein